MAECAKPIGRRSGLRLGHRYQMRAPPGECSVVAPSPALPGSRLRTLQPVARRLGTHARHAARPAHRRDRGPGVRASLRARPARPPGIAPVGHRAGPRPVPGRHQRRPGRTPTRERRRPGPRRTSSSSPEPRLFLPATARGERGTRQHPAGHRRHPARWYHTRPTTTARPFPSPAHPAPGTTDTSTGFPARPSPPHRHSSACPPQRPRTGHHRLHAPARSRTG